MCYLKEENKKGKEGNFPNILKKNKISLKKVSVNLMTGNKNTDDLNLME